MENENSTETADSVAWETICERCGRCCYEKIEYRERIFYTDRPCHHLDREKNLCRIYHQRDRLNPDCVRLTPELVAAGILPDDCPYVKSLADRTLPNGKPS